MKQQFIPWRMGLGLLGLALLAGRSHAQALYTPTDATLYQTGDIYAPGLVQIEGTYVPQAGTLLINSGDFRNAGTIGTSAATATVKLLETSTSQTHYVSLRGQALPNLTLDVPASTSFSSNGTVNGLVTLLNGHLLTSAKYVLTLGPAATLVGEIDGHYVKGRVAQARSLSGTSAVDFGSMGFKANPNGNTLPLTVERRAGLQTDGLSYGSNPDAPSNRSIDRVWALSSTTATSAPAMTLTLSWLADNDNNLTFAGNNAQVWRSDDNGSTWRPQGTAQNGSSRTVSVDVTNLNALYTVSTIAAPLPVSLTAFGAQKQGEDGLLSWQTASETNSAYFEVQASPDGQAWRTLSKVKAAGASLTARTYRYLDGQLTRYHAPTVYYRLRLADQDGSSTYSRTATLDVAAAAWQAAAYPNPYTTSLTATLTTANAAPATLTLLDATGRVVLRREVALAAGQQTIALDEAHALPSGLYTLLVQQGTQSGIVRLVHK